MGDMQLAATGSGTTRPFGAGADPRPPGRLRRAVLAHPVAVDCLLVVPAFLVSLAGAAASERGRPLDSAAWLLALALSMPLVWRRRYPVAVFATIAAVALTQWALGLRTEGDLSLLVAVYTVAAYETRRRAFIAAAVLEAGVLMAVLRWEDGRLSDVVSGFVLLSGMTTAAVALGLNVGNRRARLAYLEERAARLELERDQQARLATAAERARIAREMHDIVAHNLSVMIALADGAAFTLDTDPERTATAIAAISGTGRTALTEMRRLLGVLRPGDPGAELAPQPGIDDLDPLIAQLRAAGLPVTLVRRGARRPLPAGAELAVYRVVQEGLTNTLKHGGAEATAEVRVSYDQAGVDVEIVDTGIGRSSPPGGVSGHDVSGHGVSGHDASGHESAGHGIAGMRERVAVYGGTVTAGPRPGAGWQVGVRLDLPAEAAAAVPAPALSPVGP